MSKRGIHSTNSTNCIADVVRSKLVKSGIVTRNPAIAPASAIQRANAASRSRPTTSTATPATIGTQMASDRYGVTGSLPSRVSRRSSHAPPVEQAEDADDHHERVVIDVA